MMVFISGGVRSGKSSLGERLAAGNGGRPVYLATMQAYDEEMERRIRLHRDSRAGKGFVTLERSRDIEAAIPELRSGDAVLLDCLGTLASNEMFGAAYVSASAGTVDGLHDKIAGGILKLSQAVSLLILISNEVFSDGMAYDAMTEDYVRLMGRLHCTLAARADVAVECACGSFTVHKGSLSLLTSDFVKGVSS